MTSKLELAVIAAAIACGLLIIERGHHIVVDVPTRAERSALAAAAACPDNDTMPYPASCLAFLKGNRVSEVGRRRGAETALVAQLVVVKPIDGPPPPGTACPVTDNAPYSASCIAFLSGWFWQPHASDNAAAVRPR